MKTDALIDLLAREAGPAPKGLVLKRLSVVAVLGLPISAATAIVVFGLLPPAMFTTSVPWMKIVYALAVGLSAAWLTARLAKPGARFEVAQRLTMGVLVAMLALGFVSLLNTPAEARWNDVLGASWWLCPIRVLALSLPALAAAIWALRGLAPTRPLMAGLAAGWMAGAVGAVGYALSCPESSLPFVALWYTLGMALSAAVGAWLGVRLLRW